jgi:DNA polymerase III subunit beta
MKFTVHRDELIQAVGSVQRATSARVIQPILANVLIETDPDAGLLFLTGSDMDFSVKTSVPSVIQEPGRTTLSAKKVFEILSKLPSQAEVSFWINQETQMAHVQSGSSQFDLRTLSAEEYPALPAIEGLESLEVNLKALVKSINQTVFAAASFEANNVLGGVFFRLTPTALEMVATDGSRLARRIEAMMSGTVTQELTAIIPSRALQEFVKLVGSNPSAEESVKLAIQDGQLFLQTPRVLVISRLLDGQYPKYEPLIPLENTIIASANRLAMIASLERAAVMANERTNIVKMMLEATHLSLAANTPDVGDSQDTLPVAYQGQPLSIAFNYKYVLDALKVIESDDVRMETNGSLSPTIFRADAPEEHGYICLVMPVQVK